MKDNRQLLIKKITKYLGEQDVQKVSKAIDIAIQCHGDQLRGSGIKYFEHPIAVSLILSEMCMDTDTLITGLLHDTVEDTDLTLQDIESQFGKTVAKLVDGVTKLSKIEILPKDQQQAANFHKFFVSISSDIRVLIVKLVDRLHNMRTIDGIKSEAKRYRIAVETMEIYSMLAARIGMDKIKNELQDISLSIIHPQIYRGITSKVNKLLSNNDRFIDNVVEILQSRIQEFGIKAEVKGRIKSNYSIWSKIINKNTNFENISDIIAFRIITSDISKCYEALGAIHSKYTVVASGFNDFISCAKSNGYRSIHTTILWDRNNKIEIQIRTERMDCDAEYGIAAHWIYKKGDLNFHDHQQLSWIKESLDMLSHTKDRKEFLKNAKLDIQYQSIHCFDINHQRVAMQLGSTILDFAFATLNEKALKCVGAKVNGDIKNIDEVINNGDFIEILLSLHNKVTRRWLDICNTTNAKVLIQKHLDKQKNDQFEKI